MSLKKTAVAGALWTYAELFGSQAITFIVSMFMARMLLPSEFGLIGMIMIFTAIAEAFVNSGMSQSLIRTKNPDQEDFSTVFFFNLTASIIIYWVVFFCAPLIADFYDQPLLIDIIRVYCVIFIINAFSAVQLTRLTKLMNFKLQMLVALPSLIISGIVGLTLAYLDYGVWSLVYMAIVKSLVSTIQLWIRSGWQPTFTFNKAKFKYHIGFGSNLAASGILNAIFTNIVQIIIGRFFSAAQVGFYTRANALKQLPVSTLSGVLNKVTYPLFASIQNDDVRLKRIYRQIMQMVIFLVAPVLILLGVMGEPLFRFLFTEKWLPAVPYFQIMCIAGIISPLHSYNLSILKVKGRSDLFLKLEIIKKVNIIVALFVGLQFGIYGLLWSQVYASFASFFINASYSGRYLNYTAISQLADVTPIILIAAVSGACVYFIDYALMGNADFVRLVVGALAGSLLYLGICLLFRISALSELKNIIQRK